ncbi:MAG: putative 2OG-Fe(II) oxygenase [Sediminibacterium sp.]|jgi:hypothetical protein
MPAVIYPFGPGLYKARLSDDVLHMLQEVVERVRKDDSLNRSYKAGQFVYGKNPMMDFTPAEFKLFDLEIKRHMLSYFLEMRNTIRMDKDMSKKCLDAVNTMRPHNDHENEASIWANIQHAGDMHPIHNHPGDISFVTYIKVPELTEEDKFRSGGMVAWTYGEYMQFSNDMFAHQPEVGEIFIFPPKCRHFVWPFSNKDGERISVAGNYEFA